MATIDKILRKSNFTAAMTALITKLNGLFVRKETGKGLSTNDYTAAEKEKLAGVATGAFTLNLATLSALLGSNQSTVFTAYITAGGDYALSITNGGTIKYIGAASDLAITSAGLLLNILMTKDGNGSLTSIVQANKLT